MTRQCLVCLDQTPPRRFNTLFFEVLPFTDTASVVNGKTSKKNMQKRRGVFFGVSTQYTAVSFWHAFLRSFTVYDTSGVGKLQRKACKNDTAVFGVSRPNTAASF